MTSQLNQPVFGSVFAWKYLFHRDGPTPSGWLGGGLGALIAFLTAYFITY
jgi:hypothetical protein